jgi:hypothetical protein
MLQKSTIKEKELNIELDKKANPPTEKKIFIKKFNAAKTEPIKKKNLSKYFGSNFFIEKYVRKILKILIMVFLIF